MKSLNDSLRDEFNSILFQEQNLQNVKEMNLDINVIKKAFEVLLKFKSESDITDKARSEFENFLINFLKNKNINNDN